MMNWGLSSIYNNRLFNTPAPIGYGVTTPQDLRPYFAMGDRFYTTNFGMETQFNLFNGGYDPMVYHVAQNPQLAFTNPLLIGYNTGFDGMGAVPSMPNIGSSTLADIAKQRIAQQAPQALAALEKNLQEALKNDKLNDEQKSRIQQQLDKIKTMKEEFQQVLANKNASSADVYAVETKLAELRNEITQLGQTLAQEVQNAQSKDEKTDSTSNDDKNSDNVNKNTGRPASLGEKPSRGECQDICYAIKNAVEGWGTDNDVLAEQISKLDKSNIIEIVDYWESGMGKHTEKGDDGFFARIFDDCNDNEQRDYVPIMVTALRERAEALGISDEVEGDLAGVLGELANRGGCFGQSWTDDHKLANGLMAAVKKIKAKEAENVKDAKAKSEAEKAEKEQKQKDKIENKKLEFLNDMREVWKDDKAELSNRVKFENDKFVVRIEGRNFYGSDFNELIKNIREAGYDPEQYLKKQKLNADA